MRSVSIIFLLLASFCSAYAVKAYPYPVEVVQPDGTRITILLHGDEFFRYATTLSGNVIAMGEDGFYHYADYNSGALSISQRKVDVFGAVAFPGSFRTIGMEIPENVAREIRQNNIRRLLRDAGVENWTGAFGTGVRQGANGPQGAVGFRGTIGAKGMYGAVGTKGTIGINGANGGAGGYASSSQVQDIQTLVLLVQFSDVAFSVEEPQVHFDKMLNQEGYSEYGATGSVSDYFRDNFLGWSFKFDVSPVITLPDTEEYYAANDESVPAVITYDVKMYELVKDACDAVKSEIDFSIYDKDGDGKVDHLFVIYAGYNEAEGGGKNTIWPHSWDISSHNFKYNGVKIGQYGCTSELMGATSSLPAGIGTFCHEFSHSLGLVDLYDVNYGSEGKGKCLWKVLSIMDEGNYNNDGKTPPYYCAIDRELAGIADIEVLSSDSPLSEYLLEPVNIGGKVYRADTKVPGEYFLMEVRAQSGWDSYIGGRGMAVYHIDKSDNIAGGIRASVRWDNNLVNAYSPHECADLIEAMNDAIDISQVFFPGQGDIHEFSASTIPAFDEWSGDAVGLKIFDIGYDGDNVMFQLMEDNTERMLSVLGAQVTAYQKDASVRWKTEKKGEFTWGLRWGLQSQPSSDFTETQTNLLRLSIPNLEPKSDYVCEIFHKGKTGNGDTVAVKFTTMGVTSSFPYLYQIKSHYSVGDTVSLKALNFLEDVSSIEWYIDNTSIKEGRYVFRSPGQKELKAVIRYSKDDSQEIITKIVMIGNPGEGTQQKGGGQ